MITYIESMKLILSCDPFKTAMFYNIFNIIMGFCYFKYEKSKKLIVPTFFLINGIGILFLFISLIIFIYGGLK